jgi:hypothetical protein
MGRFVRPRGDQMNVYIKQRWRWVIKTHLTARFFARLAQGCQMHKSTIAWLGMPAWLQPTAQLDVMQQHYLAGVIIHEQRTCGEMRLSLVSGERLCKARQQIQHRREAARFVSIGWAVSNEKLLQCGHHAGGGVTAASGAS